MVSWSSTIQNLKQDYLRRLTLERLKYGFFSPILILFSRGMIGVTLYRLKRYFFYKNFRVVCKLITWLEFFFSKTEIDPRAEIGPGFVLGNIGMHGIGRNVVIGKNCTLLGINTITLGMMDCVDFEKDYLNIGDHTTLGIGARVMRPIEIAAGAQIKHNSVVMLTVRKPGSVLSGIPARYRGTEDLASIMAWNPLKHL